MFNFRISKVRPVAAITSSLSSIVDELEAAVVDNATHGDNRTADAIDAQNDADAAYAEAEKARAAAAKIRALYE